MADCLNYMPRPHRRMVQRFKSGPNLRAWILDEEKDWTRREEIIDAFDRCVDALSDFRATHIRIASEYIVKEGKKRKENAFTGTGGTPFMKYLNDHVTDTKAVRIRPSMKSGLGGLKLDKKKMPASATNAESLEGERCGSSETLPSSVAKELHGSKSSHSEFVVLDADLDEDSLSAILAIPGLKHVLVVLLAIFVFRSIQAVYVFASKTE